MRVSVIGANGQLGCDVCSAFLENGHEVVQLNHDAVDIANFESLKLALEKAKPQIVINTAAMHNIDACEANPIKAFEVNGIGAKNLAVLSNGMDFTLFHISTDYVFDGKKTTPYVETDTPSPLNVYGNTKYSGECFLKAIARKFFIVRVSGIYGVNPCRAKSGNNFVKTMLRLARERDEVRVVDDEMLAPTFTEDIARQLVAMCQTDHYGLFHAASHGGCSWHRFAAKIFELTGTKTRLSIAGPGEFAAKVQRPRYSVMANSALKKLGIDIMPDWEDGLKRYLEKII